MCMAVACPRTGDWIYSPRLMRIVSYNILDGGEGRADLLAEVIAAQRPDVVAMVEADQQHIVERIANRLKMDFIHAPGNTHASALLSRWPIRTTINHAPFHKGLTKSFLEATLVTPSGQEWIFGVLHLAAGAYEADETMREQELGIVLKIFEPHRSAGRPHLLMGDFNSNAPYQRIDPAQCKKKTQEAWEKNGGHIPRRVVQTLLDRGYVDSLNVVDPPAAQTLGTFTTQQPGQRVDYIFAHGIEPRRLQTAWIEHDRLAKYASDHFPIGAELNAE
jgi:endonuclease/exonuclease/phosphatase family metal-dependent hydrolase